MPPQKEIATMFFSSRPRILSEIFGQSIRNLNPTKQRLHHQLTFSNISCSRQLPWSSHIRSARFLQEHRSIPARAFSLFLRSNIVRADRTAALGSRSAAGRPPTACPTASRRGWRNTGGSGKHRNPAKGERSVFLAAANRMGQNFTRRRHHHFRKSTPHGPRHHRTHLISPQWLSPEQQLSPTLLGCSYVFFGSTAWPFSYLSWCRTQPIENANPSSSRPFGAISRKLYAPIKMSSPRP